MFKREWDNTGLEPVTVLKFPLVVETWEYTDIWAPYKADWYTGEVLTLWSPVTKKIHIIPKSRVGVDVMVIPPVAPNTGENYVTMLIPVHGKFDLSYDESEQRLSKEYRFDFKKDWVTTVDISIDRRAVIRRKDEDEKGPGENKPGSAGKGDEGKRQDA